jgi:type IV pilus assembly protein PilV
MTNIPAMKSMNRSRQAGMSLIEILIAIVIIAIALFGTASLQMSAMRMGQGGVFRSHAVFLAQDIAERMEANAAGAIAGSYVVALTSTPPAVDTTCETTACAQAALATYDIAQWANTVSAALPQSSWSITRTIAGTPSTYAIVVRWIDRRTKTSDTTASAITESYTLTRTILN